VPANVKAFDDGSCAHGQGAAPARSAGILANDKIIAIAGKPVHTWTQLGSYIRALPAGKPVPVVVQRRGTQLTLHVTPATIPGRHGSYLGIDDALIFQRAGPVGALSFAGSAFGQVLTGAGDAGAQRASAASHLVL